MAGDWIKIESVTPEKPEVFQMAEDLSVPPEQVVGCLVNLWVWADQQTVDGNAPGVTELLVDRKASVPGFAQAMKKVGWLVEGDDGLTFPNFGHHNGKTAKERALTAKRAAKHRQKSNANSNGDSVTTALPREEKRREENKPPKSPTGDVSGVENCPFSEIVEIYHEECPTLTRVAKLTDKRKKQIRARWREDRERQSLDWWRRYFRFVNAECPFLVGKVESYGKRPFEADIEWLTNPNNMIKVIEGKYQEVQGVAHA